ncbi:MAG: hypothetical protein JWO25_2446, partial [Alphaproteobacteria bacterium]|nr:hypothetical protein [Alphaproteobacteria bacterium]
MRALYPAIGISLLWGASSALSEPGAPDPAALIQSERDAMRPLSWMDGRWEGPGWAQTPQGRHEILQTERIGPMLSGSIKVVEGKSFETSGQPAAFNAFGVISFDPAGSNYTLHSYAQGRTGD